MPTATILTPLFREAQALPGLVRAIDRLDYPRSKLDVKLLLEESDDETIARARRLGLFERFDVIIVPHSLPQTKPKACNYGLWCARGDLIVSYDAEDEPDPDQFRIAAETFAAGPENLACVQAKLNFYNPEENWLTRLFTLEYCLWFDHFLPALDRLCAPVPLGGTSNIFRTDILAEAGGWDPHNVTEDADLGLRLSRLGFRTTVIDSTTYEQANCRAGNWMRQRTRWMKGFLQTWLVHRRDMRFAGWRGASTWGINNRTVGFRIPAGPAVSRHLEHRLAGADANPYLAIAAVLAAMHRGLRERHDPGPAVTGNGYAQAPAGELPTQWFAALDRAEQSAFLAEAFGVDFVKVFMALKRSECERFFAQPTELDYLWYLSQA